MNLFRGFENYKKPVINFSFYIYSYVFLCNQTYFKLFMRDNGWACALFMFVVSVFFSLFNRWNVVFDIIYLCLLSAPSSKFIVYDKRGSSKIIKNPSHLLVLSSKNYIKCVQNSHQMAEADKLNIDSIIARLLEGKIMKVKLYVDKNNGGWCTPRKCQNLKGDMFSSTWSKTRKKCSTYRKWNKRFVS